MNQTIAEKIISSHCGRASYAGETVVASIDLAMATDGSGPLAIDLFHQMEKGKLQDPAKIIMVLDLYVPCPNDKVARRHDTMRRFCNDTDCILFDLGEGIGHQLLPEKGYILPGLFTATPLTAVFCPSKPLPTASPMRINYELWRKAII